MSSGYVFFGILPETTNNGAKEIIKRKRRIKFTEWWYVAVYAPKMLKNGSNTKETTTGVISISIFGDFRLDCFGEINNIARIERLRAIKSVSDDIGW